MSRSPTSLVTPEPEQRPERHLPTPPPTGHREAKRPRSGVSGSDGDDAFAARMGGCGQRKGVLGEFEYLVARVKNTILPADVPSSLPSPSPSSRSSRDLGSRLRQSACLDGEWWIDAANSNTSSSANDISAKRGSSPQPKRDRATPLFLMDDEDDEDNDAGLRGYHHHDHLAAIGDDESYPGGGVVTNGEQRALEDDIEMVDASPDQPAADRRLVLHGVHSGEVNADRRLVPRGPLMNTERALQLRFDAHGGQVSSQRKRPLEAAADDDDEDDEDFAVLGAVIKTKYARVENDERERSSTPLVEVKPCETCGCACAGQRNGHREEHDDGGPVRRGGWSSSLSNRVKGNILAALLGDRESLRDKVGGAVANWADLAEKLGADRGQHDTVRRVAKNMQERLPEMMRRGLI